MEEAGHEVSVRKYARVQQSILGCEGVGSRVDLMRSSRSCAGDLLNAAAMCFLAAAALHAASVPTPTAQYHDACTCAAVVNVAPYYLGAIRLWIFKA